MKQTLITLAAALGLALGCEHEHSHDDGPNHGGHGPGGHHHEPPNGGVLVVFGDEACSLEFVRDEENPSRLTIFAHEFHPTHAYIKLPMDKVEVVAKVNGEEKPLTFMPVVDETIGNNATHSSEYSCSADWLKDTEEFEARIVHLNYPGGSSDNKSFKFSQSK